VIYDERGGEDGGVSGWGRMCSPKTESNFFLAPTLTWGAEPQSTWSRIMVCALNVREKCVEELEGVERKEQTRTLGTKSGEAQAPMVVPA